MTTTAFDLDCNFILASENIQTCLLFLQSAGWADILILINDINNILKLFLNRKQIVYFLILGDDLLILDNNLITLENIFLIFKNRK